MKAWPCLQGASFSDGTEQAETSGERWGRREVGRDLIGREPRLVPFP